MWRKFLHVGRSVRCRCFNMSAELNDCAIGWNSIECTESELSIDITLACGQAFRWKKVDTGEWLGVFSGHVWRLTQTDTKLLYKVYGRQPPASGSEITDHQLLLIDYFRLTINLQTLYTEWCRRDSKLFKKASLLKGLRQLRQDPVETLFTFICSSNNNISRISGMVDRMCQKYGEKITEVDGNAYYDFPCIEVLAKDGIENDLRELGFGYRASYIAQTARYLMQKQSAHHLHELRSRPYEEAKSELMKLHGVGAKVADCVCLMSLDKLDAIPVDTHVWQLAVREYKNEAKIASVKSITDTVYRQIGDFFRQLWGPYAGWAQSVAFTAELKQFQSHIACKEASAKVPESSSDVTMARELNVSVTRAPASGLKRVRKKLEQINDDREKLKATEAADGLTITKRKTRRT